MTRLEEASGYYSAGMISYTELGDILRGNLTIQDVLKGRYAL